MSASSGAGPRKGAGSSAAKRDRAAKDSGKRTVEYAGVTCSIPPEEPATLRWDFDECAYLEEAGQYPGGKLRGMALDLVGPEALDEIREAIASGKAGEDTTILGLIAAVIREYGSTPGK